MFRLYVADPTWGMGANILNRQQMTIFIQMCSIWFNEDGVQNFRISDAMVQLECVSLIKTVLNSKTGLEFFLEREEYIAKFAHGTLL